ncbi:MAG: tetratricopeptide repeat protein [Candidatus Competibacteraceae bacterium]|nr:tetratricopeptide repeat protein [Candidatus Competibacteraceae bacterium]
MIAVLYLQEQQQGQTTVEQEFFPSLARIENATLIPAQALMRDAYCQDCHSDTHRQWSHSMHRFSSFNNPAYAATVREAREQLLRRDGNVHASRFCAGCHDPVPLFSGAFDDPQYDDVHDPSSQAGITCTVCHAVTRLEGTLGNGGYTLKEPIHYPFADSDNALLSWVNRQLIRAKPAYHKKTFLKPLHKTAEFCAACHKVHLPVELNQYRWLRGQDHYSSFLLSGVSGHGISSFYYPTKAVRSCNTCHMSLTASEDFGADYFDASDTLKVHNHQFPAANTAIPHLLNWPAWVNEAQQAFLDDVMRVDIFGLREGRTIDAPLIAPLRPQLPVLEGGKQYLLEVVIRNLRVGHHFTQGTADSNQVWLAVNATSGDQLIGSSGALREEGRVDPWAHFVNAYVLDRKGHRIDRRNAQDIFVKLYDNQIPPGAADVVHYRLDLPKDVKESVVVEVKLLYRKFDTDYVRFFQDSAFARNDLPITTLATDKVVLPIKAGGPSQTADIPEWQRWNDYGIGLLLKSGTGDLRQAEQTFAKVERLKRPDGSLNLARVYLREGRLDEAASALERASRHELPAPAWSITWFTGLLNKQNGYLDEAIAAFRKIAATDFPEAQRRGFDFSRDYRVLNELGQTLMEQAKRERGESRRDAKQALLDEARDWFLKVLAIDAENVTAHYNLALLHEQLGNTEEAERHRALHARYKPDDNARDRIVALHRRLNPAADRAAEPNVIYDLQPGHIDR